MKVDPSLVLVSLRDKLLPGKLVPYCVRKRSSCHPFRCLPPSLSRRRENAKSEHRPEDRPVHEKVTTLPLAVNMEKESPV